MNKDFETAVEDFLQRIGREHYENGAGLKEELDVIPIFNEYSWLFERTAVDEILPRDDKEGRLLAPFITGGYLNDRLKDLSQKITNAVTKATVKWQGEEIPYRRVPITIANEPDPDKRHKLESLADAKTEEQNLDRIERVVKAHSLAREIGFTNYAAMNDELKGIKLETLLSQMKILLDETEDSYKSELKYFLNEIGISEDEATPADLTFLFRAPEFDSLFPQEKLEPALRTTLAGMGIDLDAQTNIHLDIESRPLKSPRAFCSPVRVPDEVYLVISPRGGQDDYKAILHESGHSEHLGNISSELPWVYKRLGDGSLSESYAFLMDNLMKNRHWFVEVMKEPEVDDYLRLARFHKLWILRRYAAKLHYESKLHTSSDISSMPAEYARELGDALKLKISPANFLSDIDDGLYSANYLRAWMFEVMLRRHLEESFGIKWFRTHEAGKVLMKMWNQGQTYTVDEMAQQLNYESLQVEPLIHDLTS